MTLRAVLHRTLAASGACLVAAVATAFYLHASMTEQQALAAAATKTLDALSEVRTLVFETSRGHADPPSERRRAFAELADGIASLPSADAEVRALKTRLLQERSAVTALFERLRNLRGEAAEVLRGQLNVRTASMISDIQDIVRLLDDRVRTGRERALLALAVVTTFLAAGVVVLMLAVRRRLERPLLELSRAAMDIGQGRYDTPIALHGVAEIRLVATRFEEMRRAIRERDRRREEFIAMLSHELRNPLAPVRNALHVLQRREVDPNTRSRLLQVAQRQIAHLARIVDDLVDARRIVGGQLHLEMVSLDMNRIVREVAEDFRVTLQDRQLELIASVPDTPTPILGDDVRLRQAIGNILGNAVKFTPEGGLIQVALKQSGHLAELAVVDSGPGIDAATLETLFTPFSQAPQSIARTQGGLGLGLAISRGILERHGGWITAENVATGRGAKLTTFLPMEGRTAF